jgi:hypothetical protein
MDPIFEAAAGRQPNPFIAPPITGGDKAYKSMKDSLRYIMNLRNGRPGARFGNEVGEAYYDREDK